MVTTLIEASICRFSNHATAMSQCLRLSSSIDFLILPSSSTEPSFWPVLPRSSSNVTFRNLKWPHNNLPYHFNYIVHMIIWSHIIWLTLSYFIHFVYRSSALKLQKKRSVASKLFLHFHQLSQVWYINFYITIVLNKFPLLCPCSQLWKAVMNARLRDLNV